MNDDTRKLAAAVAALNDPEWLKKNGAALVEKSAQTNTLLRLHKAGALNQLLKSAKAVCDDPEDSPPNH